MPCLTSRSDDSRSGFVILFNPSSKCLKSTKMCVGNLAVKIDWFSARNFSSAHGSFAEYQVGHLSLFKCTLMDYVNDIY